MRSQVRKPAIFSVALAAVVLLGGCGSGSSSATHGGTQAGQLVTHEKAGPNPSVSAKMICEKEVRSEIAASISVHESRVTPPTWTDHVYSCAYVYPKASIVLSVKELVSAQTTTAYFDGLKRQFGAKQTIPGLAQDAFVAKNDDVVVRKAYKVLLVDVHAIPAGTGAFAPMMSRSDVATSIAASIMSCWAGA